jgi:hypothetical protein
MERSKPDHKLDLRAGELVEVRSQEEILSTLDQSGRLDALPFMPEMLQFCGKRFRVYKRADKTCDNIKEVWTLRRVRDAVHLAGVRCDGRAHGNCDASCLIFWSEAWLKRVDSEFVSATDVSSAVLAISPSPAPELVQISNCTLESLLGATQRPTVSSPDAPAEPVYSCQATDLLEFTTHLPWWDFRQYYWDIRSGNLSRGMAIAKGDRLLEMFLGSLEVLRAFIIAVFNKLQGVRKGQEYPHIQGAVSATPTGELNLQPGEYVQVKSREEIEATLNRKNKNRGLLFDVEMLRYCGGNYRVLKRVNQLVSERTGKMLQMKSPCIILDGVSCTSEFHRLCPRAIYSYWREAWLRRVK